ncbi:MAG: hypothetical protein IJT03_03340 [Clostridia bacterium]|nr:hypothetical protein [Clostridia bacterium]
MIYSDWMSYIKDDVKLCSLVIPSTHNAGSFGMKPIACCQDGDLREQFEYGIRHYCIRIDTDKRTGEILLCHGLTKGSKLEPELIKLREMMDEHPGEFFILDIREYYPQQIGPFHFKFRADPEKVDRLLAKHLEPEKYALTDFDDISEVTIGDIRRSGKRFLMINYREEYKYSVNCPHILPWDKSINGKHAYEYVTKATNVFDRFNTRGLYWLQTQQTPNLGTDIGVVHPRKLDKMLRRHFQAIINTIANNPKYLERVNIISGDFMTEDFFKVREILLLNLKKHNVLPGKEDEFRTRLKECT